MLHRKPEVSETSAVLEVFKFIENAAAEFSDEDEDEDNEGRDRTNVESRTVGERRDWELPHVLSTHASLPVPRSYERSLRPRCRLPAWTPARTPTQRKR